MNLFPLLVGVESVVMLVSHADSNTLAFFRHSSLGWVGGVVHEFEAYGSIQIVGLGVIIEL